MFLKPRLFIGKRRAVVKDSDAEFISFAHMKDLMLIEW